MTLHEFPCHHYTLQTRWFPYCPTLSKQELSRLSVTRHFLSHILSFTQVFPFLYHHHHLSMLSKVPVGNRKQYQARAGRELASWPRTTFADTRFSPCPRRKKPKKKVYTWNHRWFKVNRSPKKKRSPAPTGCTHTHTLSWNRIQEALVPRPSFPIPLSFPFRFPSTFPLSFFSFLFPS